MLIINEAALDRFRAGRSCEWCRKPAPTDPHHLSAKGMASSKRLDIAINLCSLCRRCHSDLHAGAIGPYDLLAIVAQRENTRQDYITEAIYVLNRLPKSPTVADLAKEQRRIKPETWALVLGALWDAGLVVVAA
jgi:type II secretory ATPase GspE/PulE/Tfp pilus assembly ATPase PilB-like protein